MPKSKLQALIPRQDPQQSVEEAHQWIASTHARFSERGGIKWALEVPGEARFIGYAGIWRIFPESVRGEVGYALHPDYWGRGFATEAMRALVRFGFQELQVHSLMASINPGNSSSRQVLLKAGFQKEALLRDAWLYNGRFIDDELYGMLESDFTPTSSPPASG